MDKTSYFSWLTKGITWIWEKISSFFTQYLKWIVLAALVISIILNVIFLLYGVSLNEYVTQTQYNQQTVKTDSWNINQNQNVNLNLIYDRMLFASTKKVVYAVSNIRNNDIERFISTLGFFEYMNTKIVYTGTNFMVFFPTFVDVNSVTQHKYSSTVTNTNYSKSTNIFKIAINKLNK